jgi:copper chaperone CopZ
MANLDRNFNIASGVETGQEEEIKKALETLNGVNHVTVNPGESKITVGYTPGLISVQSIKETIESQGLDVSDKGDD